MVCKVCNTRLGPNDRHCPNCGQDAPAEAAFARSSRPAPLPNAALSTARDDFDDEDDIVELDELSGEESPRPKSAPPPPRKAEKTSSGRGDSGAGRSGPRKAPAPASRGRSGAAAPLFAPDPAGLRALLAEMPHSLEQGLEVFRDDAGKAVGAGYVSGVGEIDLLARDAKGELVVVMISEKGQGEELISEVLQRVGWIRKHVGEGKEQVRGVVLCEEAPEGLSYAAAAVAGTVSFKTWRVALSFEDLEI